MFSNVCLGLNRAITNRVELKTTATKAIEAIKYLPTVTVSVSNVSFKPKNAIKTLKNKRMAKG